MTDRSWSLRVAAMAVVFAGAACASVNTGKPPGAGFLIDLSKGHDPETQYLSNYDMDADWVKTAFRSENIHFGNTGMTLVSEQRPSGPSSYTSAEFQRTGFYGYGRYEAVLRASDQHGVVVSFFTHTGEYHGDPHNEIDFEFLGRDPTTAYLNFFRDGQNDLTTVPLGFDASAGEHLYAFEWAPGSIRWYVDGVMVRKETSRSAEAGIPSASQRVLVNVWAGTGTSGDWTGKPVYERATALYRCISHVPLGKKGPQCSDGFKPPRKR